MRTGAGLGRITGGPRVSLIVSFFTLLDNLSSSRHRISYFDHGHAPQVISGYTHLMLCIISRN